MTSRRKDAEVGTAPKLAVGYIRVSTNKQEEEGLSLRVQRTRIEAWATMTGTTIIEILVEAESAKTAADRPELLRALDLVCDRQTALVVCKIDRFARSTIDAILIAERLDKAGADLVSLSEQIDTTTANGRLIFTIFAALATHERERISERTREVLADKAERGEACGNAPFGWRAEGVKVKGQPPPKLVEVPEELETLRVMLEAWSQRRSYGHVVRVLHEAGRFSRAGKAWTRGQVRRILQTYGRRDARSELVVSSEG